MNTAMLKNLLALLLAAFIIALPTNAQTTDILPDTWVATDALGRTTPTAADAPLRTNRQRTVGIFYITWHDEGKHNLQAPYGGDVSRTLQLAPEARLDADHPAWKEWSLHWGEPEAGYFLSRDRWLIRRDLSMLADAGVDVLILDVTNAVLYWDEWDVLFDEMRRMRDLGNRVPQFCFWAFNGNVVSVVNQLYERIYKEERAKDFWFYWEGRPLLLYNAEPSRDANGSGYDAGEYTQAIRDFFTLRNMWWGYYEWGGQRYVGTEDNWAFGYEMNDSRVAAMEPEQLASRHHGRPEQMAVTPAQHPISITGKSWRRSTLEPHLNEFDMPDSAFVPWLNQTVAHPEGYGIYFQDRWDEALQVDPDFIYINDWNEWTAGRYRSGFAPGSTTQPGPTTFLGRENPFYFVDQYNAEFNRTIQPMRGGYADNYYMQMVENIRRYKGVRPHPVLNGYGATATFHDTRGDVLHRDHNGYGGLHYTDNSGRNDIITTNVSVDRKAIHFTAITAAPITPPTDPNWMLLYIDADADHTTGWEGFDFLVSSANDPVHPEARLLYSWNPSTSAWSPLRPLAYSTGVNSLSLSIARKDLVPASPSSVPPPQSSVPYAALSTRPSSPRSRKAFTIDFKWADNPTDPADIISISTTGDTAPNRRFCYRLSWHK